MLKLWKTEADLLLQVTTTLNCQLELRRSHKHMQVHSDAENGLLVYTTRR